MDFLQKQASMAFGGIHPLSSGFYYGASYDTVDYKQQFHGQLYQKVRDVIVEDDLKVGFHSASQLVFVVPKANMTKTDENGNVILIPLQIGGVVLIRDSWETAMQYEIIQVIDKQVNWLLALKIGNSVNIRGAKNERH